MKVGEKTPSRYPARASLRREWRSTRSRWQSVKNWPGRRFGVRHRATRHRGKTRSVNRFESSFQTAAAQFSRRVASGQNVEPQNYLPDGLRYSFHTKLRKTPKHREHTVSPIVFGSLSIRWDPLEPRASHPDRRLWFFAGEEINRRPDATKQPWLVVVGNGGGPRVPVSERRVRQLGCPVELRRTLSMIR